MTKIRDRAPTVAEYQMLRQQVGWRVPPAETCAAALAKSEFCAVAENTSRTAIGVVRIVGDGLYLLIVDVIVTPDFQRQHVGTQLVDRAVGWAQEHGSPHVALAAAPEVAGFYSRWRFTAAGEYLRLQSG